MKKIILALMCVVSVLGVSNTNGIMAKEKFSHEEIIVPNFVGRVERTIVKYYANYSSIPQYITYSEVVGGFDWTGTLSLQSAIQVGGQWKATYYGYISGTL